MLTEKTCTVDGVKLNYAEGPPSGSPLVLLPGGTFFWKVFLPILPQLTLRHHVFALDLRGHGGTDRSTDPYRLGLFADDVCGFIDEVVPRAPTIFGHSLGGCVGLISAARLQSVRGLAIGDSPMFWEGCCQAEEKSHRSEALAEQATRLRTHDTEEELYASFQSDGSNDLWLRFVAKSLHALDPKVCSDMSSILACEEAYLAEYDVESLLPMISCPVLLIQADTGRNAAMMDSDVERARQIHAKIRHASLDTPHMLGLDQGAKELCRSLTLFCETL